MKRTEAVGFVPNQAVGTTSEPAQAPFDDRHEPEGPTVKSEATRVKVTVVGAGLAPNCASKSWKRTATEGDSTYTSSERAMAHWPETADRAGVVKVTELEREPTEAV